MQRPAAGSFRPRETASVPVPKFASTCGTSDANFGTKGTLAVAYNAPWIRYAPRAQEEGQIAMRRAFAITVDAYWHFLADDGWAIASHIALSVLMAMFPFFIVLTSLAGFFGSKELADQAAGLMLQVWPRQVADSLSGEIHDVLTTTRGDAR